ncbi:MAG TPA: S9 family peptidase [Pyrinomonadaceae bacterium]|jgi:dipeptidyl-peptidase-4|nr:S9 family peptidase [Pyrinomonadaceae bacterium]
MKCRLKSLGAAIVVVVFCALAVCGQATDKRTLTLDRIFSSSDFRSETFGPARWLEDGSSYTTLEPSPNNKEARDIIRYEAETGARSVLISSLSLTPPGASTPLEIEDYSWSQDGRKLLVFTNTQPVWRQNTRGDYWVFDIAAKKLTKLGKDAAASTLMFAKFSPDGTRVGYVRENNIYVEDLAGNRITQLTRDGSKRIINGTFDWVYEEELDLRDGWRWSPDGRTIAYWQSDTDGVPDYFLINNTDSLYPKITAIQYPVAGQTNSAVRVGVVGAGGGDTRWLKIPGDSRNNYVARMNWAGNSDEVLVLQLNRRQNVLNVMIGNRSTGQVRTILEEKDDAWVDIDVDEVQWLDSGKRFLWSSERDGWRHVYSAPREGGPARLITNGPFDVVSIEDVDEKAGWLYFIASPDNATQRYLYRTELNGNGKPERLSPADEPGSHSYSIAPNSSWAFHTFSTIGSPPVVDLVHLPDHRPVRMLAANAKVIANVKALDTKQPEFIKVDVGEGVTLDGWMIKPPNFDASQRYPVFIYVYGEPASQTVLDRWASSRYLWHQMLAQHGYLVMSFDNRGTPAPKGRAWRKVVYRQIGVLAPKEQAAAARVVQSWPFVDSKRIAIWGWSGGGSMTLDQMFRYPDIYQVGMSVAPVTDQHFYDTIYQERYMGLPQDNEEDYKRGSPVTHAGGLAGKLLIVHGSGDDNVHYKGTEVLANVLIAAGKQFSMMEYPNRRHGISEGAGTTRHVYELLTRFLEGNLPPGAAGH